MGVTPSRSEGRWGLPLTGAAARTVREELGLSLAQMAPLIGFGDRGSVWRMEQRPAVSLTVARLLAAYRDGYRPQDWPVA